MLQENPFISQGDTPHVYVTQGLDPYENTQAALSHMDLSGLPGKRVLLKPNAGRVAHPCQGITTHPSVVAAAIDAFRAVDAEVAVGESPITGVKTMDAFVSTGIAAVAQKRGCPLIDMDARPAVEVAIEGGEALDRIQVCPEVLEYDLIVSIPVMKMHMHTGVTLAVKNMKGCLWRRSKVQLHMLPPIPGNDHKPINVAIADMASVLRPHLSIIDGSIGMEGLGPSAGRAKELGAVVVGVDAFAADAVACALMGTRAEEVPHLAIGSERGYGTIDLNKIHVTPNHWRDWTKAFARPPENLDMTFPNIQVLDNNSCSACQSTLLLFLKQYQKQLFDYYPDETPVHIAIGKGHTELPEGTLCIGNCTAKQRSKGLFVTGCPPVVSEILMTLTGDVTVEPGPRAGPQKADESPA
ncbi:DUF362 domain-containing protein [Planctomycetota bacterium]